MFPLGGQAGPCFVLCFWNGPGGGPCASVPHRPHAFTRRWACGWFARLGGCQECCKEQGRVWVSFKERVSGHTPRDGMAVSQGRGSLRRSRSALRTGVRSGCANVHAHPPWRKVLFAPPPLPHRSLVVWRRMAIRPGVRWSLGSSLALRFSTHDTRGVGSMAWVTCSLAICTSCGEKGLFASLARLSSGPWLSLALEWRQGLSWPFGKPSQAPGGWDPDHVPAGVGWGGAMEGAHTAIVWGAAALFPVLFLSRGLPQLRSFLPMGASLCLPIHVA